MAKKNDYLFKILLLGDAGSGKTKVLRRFAENDRDAEEAFVSTIGWLIKLNY